MSEKIQIVLVDPGAPSLSAPDSNKVFMCHKPPMMSVPAATGAMPADFASKLTAN
jgi:hypothetical protein